MNPSLEISTHAHEVDAGRVVVVRVGGEVDVATAQDLGDAVSTVASDAASRFVLDLSEVSFMDSSGLRVLLIATRDHGPRLAVVAGSGGAVARLFDLAEVGDRMAIFGSEEDAVRALGTPGTPGGD